MEANPAIVRGVFKGNKEVLARFWQKAEDELNAMGPPIKCMLQFAECKKVWADQKKYVRQKASQNLKDKKSTGGGPSKERTLSNTEEAIYNLIGLKASVEGVPAKCFGVSSSETEEHTALKVKDFHPLDNIPDNVEETTEEIKTLTFPKIRSPTYLKSSIYKKLKEKNDFTRNTENVLEAELEFQRELLENIKSVVTNQRELEQTTKKIYTSLDRINDQPKIFLEENIFLMNKIP